MSNPNIIKLFTDRASDGTSDAVNFPIAVQGQFGFFTVFMFGTWGGGSAKLQASPDGTNWVDVPESTQTGDYIFNVHIRGLKLRAVIAGATSPSLSIWII